MKNLFQFYFSIIILVFLNYPIAAQNADPIKNWKRGGVGSLTFGQINLTNWAAGGENSLSSNVFVNLFANYKKDETSWDNNLDISYGFLKQGDADMRKNDDKIDFLSKWGQVAYKKTFYSAIFQFKSQFTDGYNYPNDSVVISKFLAPGYIILSLGIDYKPNDNFSLYISPATGKMTIVNDQKLADQGAYGVEKAKYDTLLNMTQKGNKIRNEFGGFVRISYKKNIKENITFATKADFFSNYTKHPENIKINWDVMIAMKISKYISANISTTLIYDNDIDVPLYKDINGVKTQVGVGPRTQFKEVLGIGLSYKF